MGSLVRISVDGPDAVEVRCGPITRRLEPGQQWAVVTTHRVDVQPLQPITDDRLAQELGLPTLHKKQVPARVVGED